MTSLPHRELLCLNFTNLALLFLIGIFPASSFAVTKMAITVDDLPIHGDILSSESRLDITKKFIEVLKKHKINEAYGFVNAKKVADIPDTKSSLIAWLSAGYPLANHTYSHLNLNKHAADEFINDIQLGEPILKELMKGESYKWFRYPFLHEGDTLLKRTAVRDALSKLNYRIAQVTIDFEDWAWNNPYVRCVKAKNKKAIKWLENSYLDNALSRLNYSIAQAYKLFGRDINHVLLLHVGTFDSKMLDRLLSKLKTQGVQFITLAEAENDPAYQVDPGVTSAYGNELLTQLIESKKIAPPIVSPLPLKKLETLCAD